MAMPGMKRLWRLCTRICAGTGLLFFLATFTPCVSWYGALLAGPWPDPQGRTLIVLAGGDLSDGFPSENTALRCLYAVRTFQAGRFERVVVAGARSSRHMRNLMIAEGVPADVVSVEDASTSTRENALYTARLLHKQPGRNVLLTSDYHMFRATRCFRKAGMEIVPCPVPDALKRANRMLRRWPAFLDEAVETAKIGYYSARGWI
jgi:uncharacterized SAM-binding protein YcdF (DUF218 family)